ncbi:hypothetical protein SLS60_008005 [Paraconiothyrium brasiliense]|uniref:Uncharacterized protein n=1 Tax=Paraconiothyrium brasiliense TaxID=300254 RepID=A0ABR3R394_9PLEO
MYFAKGTGSVGQVLQNAFVDQIPVLATSGGPYSTFDYTYVYDTLGLVNGTYDARRGGDRTDFGQRTLNLRSLFESPFTANDDINNWGVPYDPYEGKYVYSSDRRHDAGHTYVPLVNNFTSGVFPLQQFAPQINSSVAFANITEAEFREKCRNETNDGGFYARYYYVEQSTVQDDTYYDPDVDFEVCMTNDLRVSPWNMTRDRQDITEELYYKTLSSSWRDATYWKITSATSLGYFEVPSERNGRVAGPLLDRDPFSNDKVQIEKNRRAYYKDTHLYRRGSNISYSGNATMNLSGYNKGPLASVAVALFGPYSFIGARMSNPSAFVLAPDAVSDSGRLIGSGNCVYKRPLASWTANSAAACFEHYGSTDVHMIIQQVTQTLYFWTESYLDDTLEALSHALFMANKLWLNQPTAGYDTENQLRIYYDAGIPTTKPEISNTGIIVGSLFMVLHLLGLLLLTIYTVMMKPWSGKMGSEIILKMGMVYSDELARSETEDQWKRTVVRLPGYIGDERPEEVIGRLRFGAAAGLSTKKDRRFEILR